MRPTRSLPLLLAIACLISACTSGSDSDSIDRWAAAYCEAAGTFTTSVGQIADLDSSADNPDEEAQRLTSFGTDLLSTSDQMIASLRAIDPPGPTEPIHAATIEMVEASASGWTSALPLLNEAESPAQIETARWDLLDALSRATADFRFIQIAQDPEILDALRSESGCEPLLIREQPEGVAIQEATFHPLIDERLIEVADMRGGSWRYAELAEDDLDPGAPAATTCVATAHFDGTRGALLSALTDELPESRGARLIFNGAIGNHGSQLWNEVWAFSTEDDAAAALAAMTEATNDQLEPCLVTALDDRNTIVLQPPTFSLADSASYAFESTDDRGNPTTRIELHVVQRERFLGLVVFYDHSPASLWRVDSERLLTLFEDRLVPTP